MNESIVDDYINESIKLYENTVNKLKTSDLNTISTWVKNVKSDNKYESIDSLFSSGVLTIENRIKSKKLISESLVTKPKKTKEVVNVPISTMVNVANKTINKYINTLSESEKKELSQIFSINDEILIKEYNTIKDSVISKLNEMEKTEQDEKTKSTIIETLNKVNNENYDKLNYYKLKTLNENI